MNKRVRDLVPGDCIRLFGERYRVENTEIREHSAELLAWSLVIPTFGQIFHLASGLMVELLTGVDAVETPALPASSSEWCAVSTITPGNVFQTVHRSACRIYVCLSVGTRADKVEVKAQFIDTCGDRSIRIRSRTFLMDPRLYVRLLAKSWDDMQFQPAPSEGSV